MKRKMTELSNLEHSYKQATKSIASSCPTTKDIKGFPPKLLEVLKNQYI